MSQFWLLFRRRPAAIISIMVLVLLYTAMIFAEFFAPYSHLTVFEEHSFHPPNVALYSKELGLRPQIQKRALVDQINWKYVRVRGEHVPIRFFVRGEPYRLLGIFPTRIHLFGTEEPYQEVQAEKEPATENRLTYPVFLFGADHLGRDLMSRILYGSRISLTIGFVGIGITLFASILLGGLAGYYGGIVDWIVMRVAEFFILIPGLYLILFLRSILLHDLDSGLSFIIITTILSVVGWPGSARLIRGIVHSLKHEDFISAAKLQGIPSVAIIFRQIIPQMSSILIVSITLGIPGFIIGETILSYIGLGIIDPAVSWGSLLTRNVTSLNNLRNFSWFMIPFGFLLVTTLAFNLLGDLLRDVFDPYWSEKR